MELRRQCLRLNEQSREDRDEFIAIDADNLIPGTEHNFQQHISDGDDIGEYDFGSIMHYPLTAFAEGREADFTILPPGW